MTDMFENINECCVNLKIDLCGAELAKIAVNGNYTAETMEALSHLFTYLSTKKDAAMVQDILNKSRLPKSAPKTFDNFDFTRIRGQDVERIKGISSLATLHSGSNITFVGPPGIGKTHLAQAYGYECAQRRIKVYFIKATELRDKFNRARKSGSTASCVNTLVRYQCLIIDEIGHCKFDKENTMLFFDVIDRRYNKEGMFNTVFTSNKQPSQWKECFEEEDALLCSLDRIFDNAIVFNLKGKSYRGRKLKVVNVQVDNLNHEDK